MKKALTSIIIAIIVSAGILFSADMNTVSASTIPLTYELDKTNTQGYITISEENLVKAIVEYTFYSNGILMSKLESIDLVFESCEIGSDRNNYSFILPEEALSFKVWRVIDDLDQIKSLDGDHEFISEVGTGINDVETRIKTLYINDDLITKEPGYSETAEVWIFKMHFNVEDAEGNIIPIDRIHSLEVEYNVVKSMFFGLWSDVQAVSKVIEATEERNSMYWPFITPQTVINHIQRSYANDGNFDWMVDLGSHSVPRLTGSDVTIDQTSIIKISYYYQDVFYEDQVVIDEPYDEEDVVPVIPGTTNPILSIGEWFASMGQTLKFIMIGIVVIIIVLVMSLAIKTIGFIKGAITITYKFILFIFKLLKFIFIGIPKAIINFIVFLIVPKNTRKEQRHVSRYL